MTALTASSFSALLSAYGRPADIEAELTSIISVMTGAIEAVTKTTYSGTTTENSVLYRSVSRYITQRITHAKEVHAGRPSTAPYFGLTKAEASELTRDTTSTGAQMNFASNDADVGIVR